MEYPNHVNNKQRNTLNIIYTKNNKILPCFNKLKFSHEKAEKVVNPPQNPIERKCVHEFLSGIKGIPQNRPIRSEPVTFTPNVAKGKTGVINCDIIRTIPNRRTLPNPPPIKTNEKSFNILFHFIFCNEFP